MIPVSSPSGEGMMALSVNAADRCQRGDDRPCTASPYATWGPGTRQAGLIFLRDRRRPWRRTARRGRIARLGRRWTARFLTSPRCAPSGVGPREEGACSPGARTGRPGDAGPVWALPGRRQRAGRLVSGVWNRESGTRCVGPFAPDPSWLVVRPADPQQLLGFGAKRGQLFKVSRREISVQLHPADRQIVEIAGPRGLAQAVVAHGQ